MPGTIDAAIGRMPGRISGWLGGEMVYRNHIGMIPEDAEAERDQQVRHGAAPGSARSLALRPEHRPVRFALTGQPEGRLFSRAGQRVGVAPVSHRIR